MVRRDRAVLALSGPARRRCVLGKCRHGHDRRPRASRDLTRVLTERYPYEPTTAAYLDQLRAIAKTAELARHWA